VLQPSPRTASRLVHTLVGPSAQPSFLEAAAESNRQSSPAKTPPAPPLRASSHSSLPKRLRQTGRFQGNRASKTRRNSSEFLVALDQNVHGETGADAPTNFQRRPPEIGRAHV